MNWENKINWASLEYLAYPDKSNRDREIFYTDRANPSNTKCISHNFVIILFHFINKLVESFFAFLLHSEILWKNYWSFLLKLLKLLLSTCRLACGASLHWWYKWNPKHGWAVQHWYCAKQSYVTDDEFKTSALFLIIFIQLLPLLASATWHVNQSYHMPFPNS